MKSFEQWIEDLSKKPEKVETTVEEIDEYSLSAMDDDYVNQAISLYEAVSLMGPNLAGGTCSEDGDETDEHPWKGVFSGD